MRRLALVAVGVAAAACTSFDLVEPTTPASSVDVVVTVSHRSTSMLALQAVFRPALGAAADSSVDSALYINGASVYSSSTSVADRLVYEWAESADTAMKGSRTLSVALPAMGLDSVDVEVPGRLDDFDLTALPHHGVLLRFPPISTPDGFNEASLIWRVSVGQTCTEMERATTAPYFVKDYPLDRLLTTENLARLGQQYVNACMRVETFYRASDARVRATLKLILLMDWRIHVIPATESTEAPASSRRTDGRQLLGTHQPPQRPLTLARPA